MNERLLPFLFTIGGITIGWLLAFLTEFLRRKYRYRRMRLALEGEIEDAEKWLGGMHYGLGTSMQMVALGHSALQFTPRVPTPVYKTHFAEASLSLSETQRRSFNTIYSKIDSINEWIMRVPDMNIAFGKDPKLQGELLDVMTAIYTNTYLTILLIRNHLANRREPKLPPDAEYRSAHETAQERMRELGNEARAIGVDAVKQKYFTVPGSEPLK